MSNDHDSRAHPDGGNSNRAGSRLAWVFFGFLAIGAFLLFTEHRAHLYGWLPFLLVALCPLMHIFGHGGHGRHGPGAGSGTDASSSSPAPRGHQH